jgi:ribonuclease E
MSENDSTQSSTNDAGQTRPRRRAAGRPAGPPQVDAAATTEPKARKAPAKKAVADKAPTAEKPAKKAATKATSAKSASQADSAPSDADKPAKRTAKKAAVAIPVFQAPAATAPAKKSASRAKPAADDSNDKSETPKSGAKSGTQARKAPAKKTAGAASKTDEDDKKTSAGDQDSGSDQDDRGDADGDARSGRRRNRRGGRNRNKSRSGANGADQDGDDEVSDSDEAGSSDGTGTDEDGESGAPRRRSRSRSRDGQDADAGSTRVDAKRNRRRDGRDNNNRRRSPILSEAEFLARRENVERVMVVRQKGSRTQIAVLEDGVLVEHYINQSSSGSLIGNVYLGRVQNVLPGMEAAFVDIGKGRNAVLYAGEVNWDTAGLDGQPKRIETALKSGDTVLVQVTKDPVGQKGARLTSQISMPGRFLVYVPNNPMTGISRKLPDRERARLKSILRQVVPEDAGVIVRTASEGASEDELRTDVARLAAQWEDIEAKSKTASAPSMLYGEPDISIKVVRDIFNEDVKKLIVSGDDAWDIVHPYVTYVAPDLADRLEKHVGNEDVFAQYRVDEQLSKALDRKVFLPSGGSLVIDRTEAMTVVDVNTGKFIGQGGNLEQTVTKNNLEAAEEIVRQLRLRDIGGIIVIDFIDMTLESNRDQVIRRLIECLGRDRTKHQVAEVTSLGLVQMTRKRIGAGLLEVFSESCDACNGRGVVITTDGHNHEKAAPQVETATKSSKSSRGSKNREASVETSTASDTDAGAKATKSGRSRGKKRVVLEMFEPPPPIESLGF